MVVVGGALPGLVGETAIEERFRTPVEDAVLQIVFGLIMYALDRYGGKARKLEQFGCEDAIVVGVAQALALLPGVSRSGVTMSAGPALGQTRESAARFSFLLATPATVGAGLYRLLKALCTSDLGSTDGPLRRRHTGRRPSRLAGDSGSLVYVRRNLTPFVVYRVLAGLGVLALVAMRVHPASGHIPGCKNRPPTHVSH